MPTRKTQNNDGLQLCLINTSFESLAVSWLMYDGWQVFTPMLDNGHKTDILISDGAQYFRIQIKTFDANKGVEHIVSNEWKEIKIDYIIYFARNGEWGFIAPAFSKSHIKLDDEKNKRFELKRNSFLKAFHIVEEKNPLPMDIIDEIFSETNDYIALDIFGQKLKEKNIDIGEYQCSSVTNFIKLFSNIFDYHIDKVKLK